MASPTLDLDSPLDSLRWVGPEFLYFVDIPWPTNLHFYTSSPKLPDILSPSHENFFLRDMTLGICERLLGITIPDELLLVDVPNRGTVLSGENLSRLLVPHARQLLNVDPNAMCPIAEAFRRSISDITSALDQAILANRADMVNNGTLANDIFIAVGTMLLALSRCARAAFKDSVAIHILDHTRMLPEIIQGYRSRLHERWSSETAHEIERLLGAGIPFIAYATDSQPTINRSKALELRNYKPLHVDPTCSCAFRGPPVADVVALLSRQRIPVVWLDGDTVVVRDSADGPYVAISHVWADGLGSTTDEGLPSCQISRLSELTTQLTPGGAFWVDALCVPRDRELRRHAIGLMARTYEEAAKVLVIDGGVRAQCSITSPKEDLLLRIATSGWMQRIWTLQEGMLARELHFQVSDGIIDCTHFNGAPYVIAKEVIPLLQHRPQDDETFQFHLISPRPPRCTFNEIIPLLRHRTTSKPEDETIAIAGLLGIDASELVLLPTAESRMRTLLMRCGDLPRCIAIYGWDADKLNVPGFTWAPVSIGGVFYSGDPLDSLWAIATTDGLRALYTVISFPPVDMGRISGLVATVKRDDRNANRNSDRLPAGVDYTFFGSENSSAERTTDSPAASMRISLSPFCCVRQAAERAIAGGECRVNHPSQTTPDRARGACSRCVHPITRARHVREFDFRDTSKM